jgi:hypothetical protein
VGDLDDPAVAKAQGVLAVISSLLVPAVYVFRLIAPLFRKKPRK